MSLQCSISGRCNLSFEQVKSAASKKAAADTQNVELYTRIHNKTTTVGRSVGKWKLCLLSYITRKRRAVLHLFL